MKCSILNVTGKDKIELVAGFPVRNHSRNEAPIQGQRPTVLLGRSYQVGNIFQTFEQSVGLDIPLSNELIRSPESVNFGRLIDAAYLPTPGGECFTPDDSQNPGQLLSLCVQGYRQIELLDCEGVEILREADATVHSAYFTDRARAYLLHLLPGSRFTVSYGVPRQEVTLHKGDRWWQLSYWFPFESKEWITEYFDLEVSLPEGQEEIACRWKNLD